MEKLPEITSLIKNHPQRRAYDGANSFVWLPSGERAYHIYHENVELSLIQLLDLAIKQSIMLVNGKIYQLGNDLRVRTIINPIENIDLQQGRVITASPAIFYDRVSDISDANLKQSLVSVLRQITNELNTYSSFYGMNILATNARINVPNSKVEGELVITDLYANLSNLRVK